MEKYRRIAENMIETINGFAESRGRSGLFRIKELLEGVADPGQTEPEEAVIESRLQKALMQMVKAKLERDISFNHKFKDKTDWQWLNRLLAAARLKELALVKIVVKGRRAGMGYDITELVGSYYGRQILKSLNFNVSRRRVVTKEEFKSIQNACVKIKLKLPEVINPTTTERFFDEE